MKSWRNILWQKKKKTVCYGKYAATVSIFIFTENLLSKFSFVSLTVPKDLPLFILRRTKVAYFYGSQKHTKFVINVSTSELPVRHRIYWRTLRELSVVLLLWNRSLAVRGLTTPIRSPRPYSPINSFLPSSFMMTERSRPLSTMKVLSDFSPCLKKKQMHEQLPFFKSILIT